MTPNFCSNFKFMKPNTIWYTQKKSYFEIRPLLYSIHEFIFVCFDLIDFLSVPCKWGPWSEFSKCDKTCGGGKRFRNRIKLVTEQYGGACQGSDKVIKDCNTQKCPGECLLDHINYFLFVKEQEIFLIMPICISWSQGRRLIYF